jgi:protein arginine kinase activator
MLCEECGQNEAAVHVTHYINGEKMQKNICASCAGKMNLDGLLNPFSLNDLFGGFITLPSASPAADCSVRCEVCGMSLNEFKDGGKLGCANCYKAFEASLIPFIKKIQGSTEHVGKAPEGNRKYARRMEIEKMKEKLNEAVRREDYEQAAEIRDKIKLAEKEGD